MKNVVCVLIFVVLCVGAQAQVDFSRFEYDWCKPHPGYKTQFALSNYETASIPVSFNHSAEVTGFKTFFNVALADPNGVPLTPEALFEYYNKCFVGSVDTVFFQGPTLYCVRLCKKQTMMYVSIQYANNGRSYYINTIEAARKPEQKLTSDEIALELAKNRSVTFWLTSARNDTTLHEPDLHLLREIAKCVRTHPNLNINIEAHTDADGDRAELIAMSREKAGFVYKKLIALGMARERAGYSGYGPAFPLERDASFEALALNNRIVLTRKL